MSEEKEIEELLRSLKTGLRKLTTGRYGTNIHVSSLVEFCAREYALCIKNKFPFNSPKNLGMGMDLTWQIGIQIHKIVQKSLELGGTQKISELTLELPNYIVPVVGSPDSMNLLIIDNKLRVLEIKSLAVEKFTALTEPYVDHVCQLSLYLWIIKKLKIKTIATDYGYVLYVSKGHKQMPFKIYKTDRNDDFLKGVEKKLNKVKTFSKNGRMPARICSSVHNMMAKRCKAKHLCFVEKK
jgi:hypothetical protein